LILLPDEDPRLIADALIQVLSDSGMREELADRSRSAYRQHFCWPAIATRFTKILSAT
jgi:glycosyltransferase involved in cell wall biosynthesis